MLIQFWTMHYLLRILLKWDKQLCHNNYTQSATFFSSHLFWVWPNNLLPNFICVLTFLSSEIPKYTHKNLTCCIRSPWKCMTGVVEINPSHGNEINQINLPLWSGNRVVANSFANISKCLSMLSRFCFIYIKHEIKMANRQLNYIFESCCASLN